MSFGTYDNQSSLNQPFNPTANNGGNDIGRSIGNSIATGLFGQNAQGPLSSVARQVPSMAINAVANLPGAPQTPQQRVEQSQQSGGILKMRQPSQPAAGPGGKSGKSDGGMQFGGGKSQGGQPGGPVSQPGMDYSIPSNVESGENYGQPGQSTMPAIMNDENTAGWNQMFGLPASGLNAEQQKTANSQIGFFGRPGGQFGQTGGQ